MPFSFRIDDEFDLLFIKAERLLTPDLLKDCIEAYTADPSFHPGIDALIELDEDITVEVDGHQASAVAVAKEGIMGDLGPLLNRVNQGQPYRVACVGGSSVTRTFFMAGLGLVNPQGKFKAFNEMTSALEWLGRKQDA